MDQISFFPTFLAVIITVIAAYYVLPPLGEYVVGLARRNVRIVVLSLATTWLWIFAPHVLQSLLVLGITGYGVYWMLSSLFKPQSRRRRRRGRS